MRKIKDHINRIGRLPALLLFLGLFLFGGCADQKADAYFFEETETMSEAGNTETEEQSVAESAEPVTEQDSITSQHSVCIVHICGAVKNPGVYELPEGSRVMDAVEAGGGFLEEADQAACNLAQPVIDGCQIYIMTKEESSLEEAGKSAGIQNAEEAVSFGKAAETELAAKGTAASTDVGGTGKVNLNTADASLLKTLPGIGDSRAEAIIAYRQEHGQFGCIEDIMKVSGIKQAAFEKIKDRITV